MPGAMSDIAGVKLVDDGPAVLDVGVGQAAHDRPAVGPGPGLQHAALEVERGGGLVLDLICLTKISQSRKIGIVGTVQILGLP